MATWARYLRKVNVQFCPFSESATPAVFLKEISTRKVAAASPKLQISKSLLPTAAASPPAVADLTYADGSEQRLELAAMQIRDVLEEIELSNGRISQLEQERGKPFS